MEKLFVEFFTCPECDSPIVNRERMKKERYFYVHSRYCTMCGKEIANAYKEALAQLKKD